MPLADQLVVPVAMPLPPRLADHVTCVTPTLSDAVPPRARGLALVMKFEVEVGVVIRMEGPVVSWAPTGIGEEIKRLRIPAVTSARRSTTSPSVGADFGSAPHHTSW